MFTGAFRIFCKNFSLHSWRKTLSTRLFCFPIRFVPILRLTYMGGFNLRGNYWGNKRGFQAFCLSPSSPLFRRKRERKHYIYLWFLYVYYHLPFLGWCSTFSKWFKGAKNVDIFLVHPFLPAPPPPCLVNDRVVLKPDFAHMFLHVFEFTPTRHTVNFMLSKLTPNYYLH